jgi:cell division septal protein FtsQ
MRFFLSGKDLREWLSLGLLLLLVFGPLAWMAWLILFTPTFQVQAITIVDARPHTADAIRSAIPDLKNKKIFFIDTKVLEEHIASTIPQVRTVHVVRKLPDTIKIVVQEKTPVILLLSNQHYYFVDASGIAYEEARLETLPGTVLPVVKNTDQNAQLTLGTAVVEPSFISFIQTIQDKIPAIVHAHVAEIRIPSLAAREVHFLLDTNWLLRFDSTRDPQVQLAILQRVFNETISDQQKKTLEYIDLRIPNRVYFKTKDNS